MTEQQKLAIKTFMGATLNSLHPNHEEYPFQELKDIEFQKNVDILGGGVYSNEELAEYPEHVLECFILKRSMEIFLGKTIFK